MSALWVAVPVAANFAYGIPWAADNNWAGSMTHKTVSWYHHWENGPVDTINKNVEYVPMYWGTKKRNLWNKRKAHFNKNPPKHILAFNEPDIETQAGMSPSEAVKEFMNELQPYADRGVKVSSPQMVYDLEWLDQFMNKCKSAGCKISFMALHWYGSHQDFDSFTNWIENVYNKYKLPIWVTEYGLTRASSPSDGEVNDFMKKTMNWMKSKDYIKRAAWNGCYNVHNPPDDFATPLNAFFSNGGALRSTAHTWLSGVGNFLLYANQTDDSSDSNNEKRALAHGMMQKRRALIASN
ncbi:hypothetical protein MNAN1_003324 [Malassezia nana]|uniref:Asl1-like glycosyl hydrolase catalytic domain-containing protein n=1 Tax=Malassezia nana TaxID=180528 RepID=A0AAF0EPD3_9BASI|nr:hypothetical protein MNAN1_003324 [Malassezia nana]